MTIPPDYEQRQFLELAVGPETFPDHALLALPRVFDRIFAKVNFDTGEQLLPQALEPLMIRKVSFEGREEQLPFPVVFLGQNLTVRRKHGRLGISSHRPDGGLFTLNIIGMRNEVNRSIKIRQPNPRFTWVHNGVVSDYFFSTPYYDRLHARGGFSEGWVAAVRANGRVLRNDEVIDSVVYAAVFVDCVGKRVMDNREYHGFLAVNLRNLDPGHWRV